MTATQRGKCTMQMQYVIAIGFDYVAPAIMFTKDGWFAFEDFFLYGVLSAKRATCRCFENGITVRSVEWTPDDGFKFYNY